MKNSLYEKAIEDARDYDPYGNIGIITAKKSTKKKVIKTLSKNKTIETENTVLTKWSKTDIPKDLIMVEVDKVKVMGTILEQKSGYCKYRRLDTYDDESGVFYESEESSKLEKYNCGIIEKDRTTKNSYSFKVDIGITNLPFFDFCKIDISLLPEGIELLSNKSGSIYINNTSGKEMDITLNFYEGQEQKLILPTEREKDKILEGVELSKNTSELINELKVSNSTIAEKLDIVSKYIRGKTSYSLSSQGEIFNNDKDENYLTKLDKSEKLDCTSAAKLGLIILREIGIPCRLCSGYPLGNDNHVIKYGNNTNKSKTIIKESGSHMFIEAFDIQNEVWLNVDSTPSKEKNDSLEGGHIDNLIKSRVQDFFINGRFDNFIFSHFINDWYKLLMENLIKNTHIYIKYGCNNDKYIKEMPQSLQLLILESLSVYKDGNFIGISLPASIMQIFRKNISKYIYNSPNNNSNDFW